jgi:hypothetical protein
VLELEQCRVRHRASAISIASAPRPPLKQRLLDFVTFWLVLNQLLFSRLGDRYLLVLLSYTRPRITCPALPV